jgi:hypothetical protein
MLKMVSFNLHSLFREYGWQFLLRAALPHPLKTAGAVLHSGTLDFSGDRVAVPDAAGAAGFPDAASIVGVGFCLKPLAPPCPSNRFNHDCRFLENLPASAVGTVPEACRQCTVREFGLMALNRGSAFYLMTSARDILFDLFEPALKKRLFTTGLFLLCRYSLRPYSVGLLLGGIRGWMFAFKDGDCADYKTWLEADRGVKKEQTRITPQVRDGIRSLLEAPAGPAAPFVRFRKRGNILLPEKDA